MKRETVEFKRTTSHNMGKIQRRAKESGTENR